MDNDVKPLNWPASHVERRSIDKLIPYARNARTHSTEQISSIASSIREWGWTNPVLVAEDGTIIAGHGRVLAARQLGITEVPVMVARGWTEAQKRAYVIADNQLGLNAGWDMELLKVEMAELKGFDFDLNLIGFDDKMLAAIEGVGNTGLTDPDAVPDAPLLRVSRTGDLWKLGRHRLICGNSADTSKVDQLMGTNLADLCFTSPPYAQQRDYGEAKELVSDWDSLMRGVFAAMPMAPEGQVLVNLGLVHRDGEWMPYWDEWIAWMREQGWRRFGWYVWDKLEGAPGDWAGRLAPSHEWVFHFNRTAHKPNKTKAKKPESIEYKDHGTGIRRADGKMSGWSNRTSSLQTHKIPDSVIRAVPHKARGGANAHHPAMFSVAFATEIIEAFSGPGQAIYEPFSGSGTTIIAAEMTGRACHAIEINPFYVDVALLRWQEFTGEDAILVEDGRTFLEMRDERAQPENV